jgi:hypothetical protein
MTPPSDNGNGRVHTVPRAPAKRKPLVVEPQIEVGDDLNATTIADHEIETQLKGLEARLRREHPEMAVFLSRHAAEIRSMMTATLDAAIQSERRRLTWLLHNDLANLLSAARERLSAVAKATPDEPTSHALRGIDICLGAAAKATRGLITDLSPPSADNKKE